ncbi:MAG: hypothetical protein OQK32_07735, partial [Gammaproteobacteria bacterium]|nr:hypothetical protein [Gammaproteobacteria bacterium]
LCIVKVLYPSVYRDLAQGNISYRRTIEETQLQTLEADYWKGDKPEGHPLRWLLKYYLSNDEEVKELLTHGNYCVDRSYGRAAISNICGWLETFKR